MSELEELPSWAGRSTEEVHLPPRQPDETEQPSGEQPAPPTEPEAVPASPIPAADPDTEIDNGTAAPAAMPATAALATETGTGRGQYEAPPTQPTRRRRGWSKLLLILLGVAFLIAAGAVGYLLASSQDSDETAATAGATDDAAADEADPAGATATDDAEADADDGATATDDGTDAEATGDDGAASESSEGTADDAGTTSETVTVEVDGEDDAEAEGDGADIGNDGGRQAFFRGGVVYLTGAVPSEEVADLIVEKASAVVGPDNVVNEYVIDPTVTINPGDSAPLYVEDVILFEFNSVEIAQPFLPILDLGVLLLSQNPQASVTVVTRTDAVGSEEVNLEVAAARAQAVINYWVGKGVNPDQIIADPRGEEGTSEDDDAETAATQRRAEFIITGLLD